MRKNTSAGENRGAVKPESVTVDGLIEVRILAWMGTGSR